MTPAPALLHDCLRMAARRWPGAVAIDTPPTREGRPREVVTYAQLDARSDTLAGVLAPHVRGESIVAILVARDSHRLYAAQLAVLKAGAAYTCVDPSSPDVQLREILADADAVAAIADVPGAARLHRLGITCPVVDVEASPLQASPPGLPEWLTPRSLAYVIYTSGTTGRPKGVMIEHRGIVNLVTSDLDAFGLGPGDRVGQTSSAAYDSSVEETWLALASGATLVVMDDDASRLGPDLVSWLARERVTVLCPTPTLLRATGCECPREALPDLRLVYAGGEALPPDVVERWAPGRELVNGYGPTEATVTAIRERITDPRSIGIGRPVRGTDAWVLDAQGLEAGDDEPGELCLGGAGLARGYWRQPEMTAARFPEHPRFGRILRTGDMAHRGADGRLFYHGRIDSLVKLRGYRIELEAIETRLVECAGVREAACCVQGESPRQSLVAFVVPADGARAPAGDRLREALARVLPAYMVPSEIGVLDALPLTVGGKLDRSRLPRVSAKARVGADSRAAVPTDLVEAIIADAMRDVLRLPAPPSTHDDFFAQLGGDSLAAGLLVSALRRRPETATLATRDLYEAPTVSALALRARTVEGSAPVAAGRANRVPPVSTARSVVTAAMQGVWLAGEVMLWGAFGYVVGFRLLPALAQRWTLAALALVLPSLWVLLRLGLMPMAVGLAVLSKRLLIGRYQPSREPAWGSFHLRHWMVQRVVRVIPWNLVAGTEFQNMALRALGARVGRRVHIHRGVDVRHGGWDLLSIGDDVSLARDAAIRLVDLEAGGFIIGPIALGHGATLDVHAGMAPGTRLGDGAALTAWSSLTEGSEVPAGECWDGVPAAPAGRTPPAPATAAPRSMPPVVWSASLISAHTLLWTVLALPAFALLTFLLPALAIEDADSMADFVPVLGTWHGLLVSLAATAAAVPLTVALEALASRALGAVRPGVVDRWSWAYIRVCLKSSLLDRAGSALSGTLFWPVWLRWAGMRIGPDGEISTIVDTVPELVEIGPECFLADGVYLGGPRIDRGTVTLGPVRIGARTFIGNHAVVPAGARMPDDLLLGVCTVADPRMMRAASGWFGHPPLALPPHTVAVDRRLTHDPSSIRFVNRVFWETLRFGLPTVPILVAIAWADAVSVIGSEAPPDSTWRLLALVTGATGAAIAALCATTLALKWVLLGRARPGEHALWSCWCSRWDFFYVAWGMYAREPLSALEGTVWLSWYLRAMGMSIGRRVLLGAGFAQVVDPDMLVIEDDATVNAMFQAHTFEDRVLKIDRVHVRRGATLAAGTVPLYGADIGEGTMVAPHSVVMKGERLAAGARYEGAPTR